MILKDFSNFLTEKRLTIPELNKEEKRWEMFLTKLKNDSPFILEDEGEVKVNNADEVIQSITDDEGNLDMDKVTLYLKPRNRYAPVIKTDKGEFKLNQFHKTVEFGGGTGTSLGTVNARTYETIQALFFSLRQYLGREIDPGDIHLLYTDTSELELPGERNTADDKSAILDSVKSTKNITRDDLKFFEDKGWIYTYVKTANVFYGSLNENKDYIFHHAYSGEGIADAVYRAFIKCIRNINKENKVRISMSRWNPSDIWAVEVDMEQDIISVLQEIQDMTQLNTVMDSLFDDNFLVGISLKKIPFDREIQLIVSKTLQTNFTYDYSSTSLGAFDTLTVQIHSKSYSWLQHKREETLDARIFSGKQEGNIFLEVRGSASKYGKASLTYINSVLGRVNIESIPAYQKFSALSDEQLRRRITKLYETIPNLEKVNTTSLRWNIKDVRSKLISKYQSLLFVSILEKYKKKPFKTGIFGRIRFLFNSKLSVTNYVVKEIFYYAYSMGGELFDNCKFYRIKTH